MGSWGIPLWLGEGITGSALGTEMSAAAVVPGTVILKSKATPTIGKKIKGKP